MNDEPIRWEDCITVSGSIEVEMTPDQAAALFRAYVPPRADFEAVERTPDDLEYRPED